jgi:retinol dehydrogenase 12
MYPPPMGAITQLYAATSPVLTEKDSGRYFIPWARPGTPKEGTQDSDLANKLWDYLEHDVEGNQ